MAKKKEKVKPLSNTDVLESYGLVEIFDPRVGAYCQVKREDAEKLVMDLEKIKKAMEGKK